MMKTLTFLVATTALTAAIGIPAWSAMQSPAGDSGSAPVAAIQVTDQHRMVVADSDRDEARGGENGDEDDDDCEGDDGCGAANNPAPVDTVAPPQNGLFGNGAAPQVQVN